MLFKASQWLFRRLIQDRIFIGTDVVSERLRDLERACVVTSPAAWSLFSAQFDWAPARTISGPPLQVDDLTKLATSVDEKVVVGIGGGGVVDCAQAIAKIRKARCVLIPTILSTTGWMNKTASLKQHAKVHHVPGRIDEVLIDPVLIAKAPQHLNSGGIADILCGFNSLGDWILAEKARGKTLPRRTVELVLNLCNGIKSDFESHLPMTPSSVEFIATKFIEALSLCWGLRSGRPVEGSEHLLYYALEETHDQPMNHGAIIAQGTLVCLRLRGRDALIDPAELKDFYDRIGISYRLSTQGISRETYETTLRSMRDFVTKRKLPYSLWSLDDPFGKCSVEELLDWMG